jgi:Family of unknown function (DUF6527)
VSEFLIHLLRSAVPLQLSEFLRRRHYKSIVRCPQGATEEIDRLVGRGHFVIQEKGDRATWLHLLCPCRCGAILRVNLMTTADPSWSVVTDRKGRATVRPSLIAAPCGSHFWIENSSVCWA